MEDYIPTFEEETQMVKPDNEFTQLMVQVDDFEEQVQAAKKVIDKYDEIKDTIKKKMVEIGKANDLTQVKWTTPKGIQITCSIGQKPIFEKVTEQRFDVEILKKEYPEVYEKCMKEVTYDNCVKAKSYDRLVVTLPKD